MTSRVAIILLWILFTLRVQALISTNSNTSNNDKNRTMKRRSVFQTLASSMAMLALAGTQLPLPTKALSTQVLPSPQSMGVLTTPLQQTDSTAAKPVAYKGLSIDVPKFGVTVPVACWFPSSAEESSSSIANQAANAPQVLTYPHRISVKRIGQLLAGMSFIPEWVSKKFELKPTLLQVANGEDLPLPSQAPVVILAHGYLGSRFDLSHLAESLAQDGFVCFAPEYPESLAASFERKPGLDRSVITNALLDNIKNKWNFNPSKFGIVGHSMGCGTAVDTGDDSWTRVLIAGFPRQRDGSPLPGKHLLYISSMNDGLMSMMSKYGRAMTMPTGLELLTENAMMAAKSLPNRIALILDRADAPNHISFLSESVNDAMIALLSPLLPLAQAMRIPVLDFDRYHVSRDSAPTAALLHPIIRKFMNQQMMTN